MLTAPPLPTIPSGTFLVTNYGAVGDGATVNTTAIQNAINAANSAGGGTVEIPNTGTGVFMSGPITLNSKIRFQIDSGAMLKAVPMASYPNNTSPSNFISFASKNNIEIVGPGTIDGNGADWWAAYNANSTISRPRVINITGSTGSAGPTNLLYIHNVRVQNSPQFNIAFSNCTNVTVDNVTIVNPSTSPNTDGMDVGGQHILIQNCTVDTGDDNVVLKPGSTFCSDIMVTNCTFLAGHGLSIGGQTNLGVDGFTATNITFNGTTTGLRLKASRIAGGLVKNLTYSNITMTNVQYPINFNSYYLDGTIPSSAELTDTAQAITATTPYWQDISVSNLTSTNSNSNSYCGVVWGLPEATLNNLTLTNVNISAVTGMDINHVRGMTFDSTSHITASSGNNLLQYKGSTLPPIDSVVTLAPFGDADVNTPGVAGFSLYNPNTGTWTISGGGAGLGVGSDQFNYASTSWSGDGTLQAKVVSETGATNGRAGVMFRNGSTGTDAFAAVLVTPSSGTMFVWRSLDGGAVSSTTVSGQNPPRYVRLVRAGSSFTAFYSSTGTSWTQIGSAQTVTLATSALAGLTVTSQDNSISNSVSFTNAGVLRVASAAAATPSTVTGNSTALSALGANLGSESTLSYSWSAVSIPSGASNPLFSPNGTNAAKNATALFSSAGNYTLRVTITDTNGPSVTSDVNVTVSQTPTSLTVSPNSASIYVGGTQQFSANVVDQFGNSITSPGTINWSASGAGNTISASGLFTAGSSSGSSTVTASVGSASGNASVTINPLTFTVSNTNNSGAGSLRQAILDANAAPNLPDTILFTTNGDITLTSPLPNMTRAVTFSIPSGNIGIGVSSANTLSEFSSLTLSGGGSLTIGGNQSHASAATINVSAGSLTLTSDAGSNVTLVASAPVALGSSQHLAGLTINGSTAYFTGSNRLLAVSNLSISGGGQLDLANNKMIVHATSGNLAAMLANVSVLLATGRGSGASHWNGPGINSSTAFNNTSQLTAIGMMSNAVGAGQRVSTFGGEAVSATDILLKYTYYGDANLDGVVNGSDYALTDNGFNFSLSGFGNGDFNYDGAINGADYALLDNAFNFQSGPLSDAGLTALSLSLSSNSAASNSAGSASAANAASGLSHTLTNDAALVALLTSPSAVDNSANTSRRREWL